MNAVDIVGKQDEMTAGVTPYTSLALLEDAIRRDLEILEYPAKKWMEPIRRKDGAHVHDVVVVGGGHCGLTIAFALMRERIHNVVVIDENPHGREGPWQTYAHMPDLRTRKAVTGTELGYPNLTFRAYFEAREGVAAYRDLKRISCDEWSSYLLWLRQLLNIPFENDTRMELLEPDGDLFRLHTRRGETHDVMYARRVVLAWGPLCTGGPTIPNAVKVLPPTAYQHVYEDFDLNALRSKRVIVVGAGASGFDNAGAALEHGAAEVHLLVRRPKVPRLSLIRWTDWAGFLNTYADLDDSQKWQLAQEVQRNPAPPTMRAIERVEKWPNFHIHFSSPIETARMHRSDVVLQTPRESIAGDIVLLATGFSFDLKESAPLAKIADQIALWSDRFTPPDGPEPVKFRNSPYLGRHYQFTEKVLGAASYLEHIFNFNQSATLSMGPTGRVSGLKYGIRRLMLGISASFVREDFDRHLASVKAYNDSDLDGHSWVETPSGPATQG